MPTKSLDVLVLGAGTAGMSAYRAAVACGAHSLLVESGEYGTTCARVGCMPSKLLIAAADAAHAVENAHSFGIGAPGRAAVDGGRVMERVRRERDRFVAFVTNTVDTFPAEDRLRGAANFLDDHTVRVGCAVMRAKAIVIATGSRPLRHTMFDGLGDRLLISDDVFSWEALPNSVAVFGAGIIGLELGQALSRLGVRVRLFGHGGSIRPLTDPALQVEAARLIGTELGLRADARVLAVERLGGGVRVTSSDDRGETTEQFDFVLAATGRIPNVDYIGLEHTTLSRDKRGIPHFDRTTLQCGTSSVFLAGDANNDAPLLHEAQDEGAIAGNNAARFPVVTPGVRRSPLSIVFTDPQMALVGETWAEVRSRDPVVGRVSFEDQGRSRVLLVNRGRLHLYADRNSARLLGAEMLAPAAEHLAHLLAWAHQLKLTLPAMLALPFYHPVIEEALRTAIRDALSKLRNASAAPPHPPSPQVIHVPES